MKELSIKEKAKRYDEAIIRGSRLWESDSITRENYEYIFPELKESEDERIRKELITHCRNTRCVTEEGAERIVKWISWLEKQGNNTCSWKPTEEQYEALDYAYNSCPDTEMGNYYEGVLETLIDDLHKMSEKQGEQEETICDKCKKAQPSHSCQDITALGRCYIEGMNASNKVEPKFNVGDTIIKKHNSDINKFGQFTITDITGGKYWYNDRIICDISEQYEWELVEKKPISFDTSTPVSYDDNPFGEKDYELHEATYFIPEGFHAEIEGDKVIIKRGEQKPINDTDEDIVEAKSETIYDSSCCFQHRQKLPALPSHSFLFQKYRIYSFYSKQINSEIFCLDKSEWLPLLFDFRKRAVESGLSYRGMIVEVADYYIREIKKAQKNRGQSSAYSYQDELHS